MGFGNFTVLKYKYFSNLVIFASTFVQKKSILMFS